jgi:predicted DNA-binding transcriptional regulator AlpA
MSAMAIQNPSPHRLKAAVSVTAMAKLIGMSKSSFYDYVRRGVFPYPLYTLANRRPFYTVDVQQEILAVRQTGIGCNGEYVLFYERREKPPVTATTSVRRPDHSVLIEGLKSLGLNGVTAAQIDQALTTNFPNGTANIDEAVVLRLVYRHLRGSGSN